VARIIRVKFNRFVVACGLARDKGDKRELIRLLERIGDEKDPHITAEETRTLLAYLKPKRGRPKGSVTPKGDFMRRAVTLLLHAERELKAKGYSDRDFRQEAERQVLSHLAAEGYDATSIKKLHLSYARRRGRKR
jgi:hypothetical protein